ncbi:MAG TPA: DUF6770 family protein [Puia sp.]
MKKLLVALLLFLTVMQYAQAQTKVFKEVGEEISSQVKAIVQDNALVGYLVFTQLEKASEDSFNYKITIMDENLNDIGAINFREQKLILQGVSLEQDVLCLAYLKSNVYGNEFKTKKECRSVMLNTKDFIFTQFLSLNGKILNTNSIKAEILYTLNPYGSSGHWTANGKLQHNIQIKNIPQRGFACFYGDEKKNNLVIFNPDGRLGWQRPIKEDATGYLMLASDQDVYLLMKQKDKMLEGGYELLGFNIKDTAIYPKYILKDKQGNSLKVLTFADDPVTGKPYLSGTIIDPRKGNKFEEGRQLANGTYSGVFTINLNNHKKGGINEEYSYWADGSKPFMSKKGLFIDKDAYLRYMLSFKDYQGNTYFTGSSFVKKPRWGAIVCAVIFSPLILPPIVVLGNGGAAKCKIKDPILLRQDAKGTLSYENSIPGNKGKSYVSFFPLDFYDGRSFYRVTNADTRTDYVILDDVKDIVIYNVTQKKVQRTIPHKDGNILTTIFPAKEGHVMVSEYNKKEKYTRVSIEAL